MSHGIGDHEFRAGSLLLQKCLSETPGLSVEVHTDGWPTNERVFENVDAIVFYADGESAHPVFKKNRSSIFSKLEKQGVGFVWIHYALGALKGVDGHLLQQWAGAFYEHEFTANPMWTPDFLPLPNHPICNGVKPFKLEDEWYFNLRFNDEAMITPILQATPSIDVRDGPYVWPAGPFPHIIEAEGKTETIMWLWERANGGKSVGFTGGHRHTNWGNDDFRTLILNSILWASNMEVPEAGVQSVVTESDLAMNLDPK